MPTSGEQFFERWRQRKLEKQLAALAPTGPPDPESEPKRKLSDRERVHFLLDHLLRYRASLNVLFLESGSDLPFEAWVETIHVQRNRHI